MNTKFIIFLLIIFSVYFLANLYLFIRGWQALPSNAFARIAYSAVFATFSLSFVIIMIGEGKLSDGLSSIFHTLGSTWLAAMLYFIMCAVFFDLIRLINHFTHFYPNSIVTNYGTAKLIALSISVLIVGTILLIGNYRFTHPVITKLEVNVAKKAGDKKQLRIAMASDIHLGHGIKHNTVKKYIDEINLLNPDIVLIAGDIIDRDLNFVIRKDIAAEFKRINAPLGVYAVLGNHEYISQNVDEAYIYLQQSGIKMLRDEVSLVDSSFYIIGRDDHTNADRQSLSTLTDSLNKTLPLIMLDHQPAHLEEAENTGIDMQLSGHTHNGQLFPLNFITQKVYEVSYGYKQKGKTHVYVSSGLGLWGPPFRIGTKSEIVDITINFTE